MNFTGKILLADDEAHIRKFIGILVRRLGSPTVIEAREGQEAVELFSRESPDLVLLDISMPVLDGLQALAAIRQADPEAVVIMLTSMTNRKTIDECLRLGATAYLRKDMRRRGGVGGRGGSRGEVGGVAGGRLPAQGHPPPRDPGRDGENHRRDL